MTRARRRRVSTWCGRSSRPCGMRWPSSESPRRRGWRRRRRSPRGGRAASFDVDVDVEVRVSTSRFEFRHRLRDATSNSGGAFSGRAPALDGTDAGMDGRRLREKIELTIDDRQVAALAVGALLLLAGM